MFGSSWFSFLELLATDHELVDVVSVFTLSFKHELTHVHKETWALVCEDERPE